MVFQQLIFQIVKKRGGNIIDQHSKPKNLIKIRNLKTAKSP